VVITAVLVDSREPTWVRSLAFGGAMKAISALECGDLWATTGDGAMVCVERKTSTDLLGSLSDERLWHQLTAMRAKSQWAYLVITGVLQPSGAGMVITDRGETGWKWASVQGALIRAQECGVVVVHAAGDSDYEATVERLCARARSPELVLKPVRTPTVLSVGEQVLASLPGIGLDKAQALLSGMGTAAWGLVDLTDMRSKSVRGIHGEIKGIGDVTKRRVRAALGIPDSARLVMADSDDKIIDPWDNPEAQDNAKEYSSEQQLARSA
jgi:ERCC4-type nuclease